MVYKLKDPCMGGAEEWEIQMGREYDAVNIKLGWLGKLLRADGE